MFCKKGVLRNFAKFTRKHLCQSLLFNKVAWLSPATLLKKKLWHRCFPVNFAKFLKTPFLTEEHIFLQNASSVLFCLVTYSHILENCGEEDRKNLGLSFQTRSNRRRSSMKKGVLKNFAKFTGKHLCQGLFFDKVAGGTCNFIKKRLWHRCFPTNFANF